MSTYKATSSGAKIEVPSGLSKVKEIDKNTTINFRDHKTAFVIRTDGKVITLPKINTTTRGLLVSFINIGANTSAANANNVKVQPNASDGIIGSIGRKAGDSSGNGVGGKYFENPKADAFRGDHVTLLAVMESGDLSGAWQIMGGSGKWVQQT